MPANAEYLAKIKSSDKDQRFEAWRAAAQQDPANLPDLAKIAESQDPGVAKAAREAMTTMVHGVGKSETAPGREAIAGHLTTIATSSSYSNPVRTHALRLLSLIGGNDSVQPVAKLLTDPALREEAIFCLERIPTKESAQAMTAALRSTAPEFQPRILAALGHRRVPEATPLCVRDMKSADKTRAVAAAKAFGRIGQKPAGDFVFPASTGLSSWQSMEVMDSQLRYADSQGNSPAAIAIYKTAMARSEPHWQCAGIIGLAKIGTPEATAAIYPMLKSKDRTVRITAANAWKRIAETEASKA